MALETQPQPLARPHRNIRPHRAVDQSGLARARLGRVRHSQYQRNVTIDIDRLLFIDDERPMQTLVELLGGMGVVPERARVGWPETVIEAPARRDGHLGEVRDAVHGIGASHTVAMKARRLVKLVEEAKVELLALPQAQQRPGNGSLVGEKIPVDVRMQCAQRRAGCLLRPRGTA